MDGPAFPNGPAFPGGWHAPPASDGGAAAAGGGPRLFGNDGFSFWDLVDIINPLQHIPVISTLYRKITGDTLDALPRLAGGALFGGIAGAVSAAVNVIVNEATGRDIGAHVLAALGNGLGIAGAAPSDPELPADPMLAARSGSNPEATPNAAPDAAIPVFSAGWQAAAAMPFCDRECLDPKRSFTADAAAMAATRKAAAVSAPAAGDQAAAAARYAEAATTPATTPAAGRRLDMHG